jgi:hypothetical protein
MKNPIIGYNNVSADYSTLTATTEATDYEAINCTTWLPYEWYGVASTGISYVTWTFTTVQDVDYIALFSHNLSETTSSADFEYFDGVDWLPLVVSMDGSNSQVVMRTFTLVSSTQFRLKLTAGTTDLKVGICAFGKYLEMEYGLDGRFSLPHLQSKDKVLNGMSETGLLLGRSVIANKGTASFNFSVITRQWVENNWLTFLTHAKIKPFFVSWNDDNYPNDAVFCVTDGSIQAPRYNEGDIMSLSLKCDSWHTLRV